MVNQATRQPDWRLWSWKCHKVANCLLIITNDSRLNNDRNQNHLVWDSKHSITKRFKPQQPKSNLQKLAWINLMPKTLSNQLQTNNIQPSWQLLHHRWLFRSSTVLRRTKISSSLVSHLINAMANTHTGVLALKMTDSQTPVQSTLNSLT